LQDLIKPADGLIQVGFRHVGNLPEPGERTESAPWRPEKLYFSVRN
jgi:hypothetical protein